MASVLRLLAVLLAAAVVTDAVTIVVTNKCGYTVWPAALPGGGTVLNTGESWSIDVPAGTRSGRVWGRTGCGFIANGTLGQCQTGDCGGTLACSKVGFEPITLAEYSLATGAGGADQFDISLVHGFNAPMSFLPSASRCARGGPSCPVQEITFNCPSEQRRVAGCGNPCDGKSSSCGPNNGTEYFKKACPQTITYPRDTTNTVFTCPTGTNYKITFCP
ncbi:protein P21-like [Miscanthus floridulus]|uniref:protein P21-like n=1 Tax=Miscanthus floridulus TaxID=154761 RepID=UPI003459DC70